MLALKNKTKSLTPAKNLSTRQMINRLKKFCSLVSDTDIRDGLNWYQIANTKAFELVVKYSITVEQAAQVIALLSPQVTWAQNLINADTVINAFKLGGINKVLECKMFASNQQKIKCAECLQGVYTIPVTAQKTYSFYKNILLDKDFVTIDRHAIKAACNESRGGGVQITSKQYKTAAEAFKRVASLKKLTGYQLQAILWLTYKRVNNR